MEKEKNNRKKTNKTNTVRKYISEIIKKPAVKIILAVICVLLLTALKGLITGTQDGKITVFSDSQKKCTYVSRDGRIISDNTPGELSGEPVYSSDGKTAVFLTYSQDDSSSFYTLFAVRNNKVIRITNNVSSSFKISSDGSSVIFKDREGALKLNSISSQSDNTIYSSADEYCISPDGKTAVFSAYDEAGLSLSLYCYRKGSVSEIGTGLIPIGTENDAKTVYACDTDFKTLYSVSSDGKEKNKISDISDANICFNSDLTQMIFSSDSGTYICFSGSVRKPIYPFTDAYPVFYEGCSPIITNEKHGVKIYPTDDFTDMYYYLTEQKTLSYIDSNCARNDISDDVTNVKVSYDLKHFYFTDSSKSLYMIKNKKDPICIKNEISDFEISANGKFYSFTNSSGGTEFAKGEKTFFTAENVKFKAITDSSKILYMSADNQNQLFEISKTGKTKQISDSVSSILFDKISGCAVYFENNDKNETVCKIVT